MRNIELSTIPILKLLIAVIRLLRFSFALYWCSSVVVLCLQAYFEQVRGIEMQWPADTPQKQVAKFNQAAVFLEMDAGKNNWDGTIGFPPDYNWVNCNTETDPMIREEILQSKDLDINSHWLVHKEKVCYSSTKKTHAVLQW